MVAETKRVAVFTLWLVVVTGALAIIAMVQAWVAHRSARRELRAYVGVAGGEIRYSSASPICDLVIQNFGQTPARDVEYRVACQIGAYPVVDFPAEPRREPLSSVLWPAAPNQFHSFVSQLAGNGAAGVSRHEDAIYIYGDIGYRDVFGARRVTKFRLMFRRGPTVGSDPERLEFSPDGNDAT